ncbi:unnamed protein product, partial [Oppiella nova]
MDCILGPQMSAKKTKMSTNDTNGTHEEYPKDSFERLGDDLCGLVLSYLSLKDSFRYECLSKQWRRSVHQKRRNLVLKTTVWRRVFSTETHRDNHLDVDRMNSNALMSVIRKLPNITSIDIEISSEATEKVFEVLIHSYKHSLTAIDVRFCVMFEDPIADRLLRTYGSLMTEIWILSFAENVFKRYTNSYTKLTQLSTAHCMGYSYGHLQLRHIFNESNALLVKSLTGFICSYNLMYHDQIQHLRTFVDHYKNSLKRLHIKLEYLDNQTFVTVMRLLSKLKALRELSINTTNINNPGVNAMDYYCKQVVNWWPQLKRYSLLLKYQKAANFRPLFESVSRMRGLRRFQLLFMSSDTKDRRIYDLSLNSLSGFQRLQHLDIDVGDLMVNERFFDDIHRHVPRLQSLRFVSKLEINAGIEKSVKRLPRLCSLGLKKLWSNVYKKTKMSTNDTNGTQEEYPKDSFDRFGDDLCGLVLSYLEFEECFRYECLSKQWQRCVFTRRHSLSVSAPVLKKFQLRENNSIVANKWTIFESVVKKCPNITSIDMTIDSQETAILFGTIAPEEYIRVMKLLPQLKALRELVLVQTFSDNADTIQSIVDYHCDEFVNQWPQLKRYRLQMWCKTDEHVKQMYESVSRMKRLRKLELSLSTTPDDNNPHTIELTPKSLAPLKRLTHLKLQFPNVLLNETYLDSIDKHLPHIQTLVICTLLNERRCNVMMLMNDMNRTPEECYPKDSFERLGDDLCGLVLSYLSFEDCFRFECLSKQWKRSVFKSQHFLNVRKLLNKWQKIGGNSREDINWQIFASVVRKCANITSIRMKISTEVTERVYECNAKIMDRILGKYGSQLTAISVPTTGYEVFKHHSKTFTKLRQFPGYRYLYRISGDNELITLFNNLTHFHFIYGDSDWQQLTAFVDYYRNSLKSFAFHFNTCNVMTGEDYIRVLEVITQLKALRELRIEI